MEIHGPADATNYHLCVTCFHTSHVPTYHRSCWFPTPIKRGHHQVYFWIQEVRLRNFFPHKSSFSHTTKQNWKKNMLNQILNRSSNSKNTKCHLAVVEELPFFLDPPFWNHCQPPFPAHNSRQLTKTGRVSQTPKLRSKDPKAVRPQVTQLTDSTFAGAQKDHPHKKLSKFCKLTIQKKVAVTLSVYKLLKMRCPKQNPMVNDLKWFISRMFRMLKHFEKRHFCHFSRATELQTILLISAGFIECRPVKKGMERDSALCLHF